jgi:starvation-inducible outer membrane lipoprotein
MMKKLYVIFGIVAVLSACASKQYSSLSGTVNVLPEEVISNEKAWQGTRVQWGGKVLSVFNESHSGRIEVLTFPVDVNGRPDDSLPAGRRIFARSQGYIESASYPVGTLITVNATIRGIEVVAIGRQKYQYVSVDINGMTSWESSNFSNPTVHFGIGIGIGL